MRFSVTDLERLATQASTDVAVPQISDRSKYTCNNIQTFENAGGIVISDCMAGYLKTTGNLL